MEDTNSYCFGKHEEWAKDQKELGQEFRVVLR